jgi:hypothetical protein
MSYPYGQVVPLIFSFTDNTFAPADPATVVISQRAPDGVVSVLSSSNPTVGEYRVSVAGNQPGRYVIEAVGIGNGIDTSISYAFVISPSQVAS